MGQIKLEATPIIKNRVHPMVHQILKFPYQIQSWVLTPNLPAFNLDSASWASQMNTPSGPPINYKQSQSSITGLASCTALMNQLDCNLAVYSNFWFPLPSNSKSLFPFQTIYPLQLYHNKHHLTSRAYHNEHGNFSHTYNLSRKMTCSPTQIQFMLMVVSR